jgi:di/tricarboxylate transporter
MDLAWLSLSALIAIVILSCTTRVNPGLAAIALACGVVAYAYWWFPKAELSDKKLLSFFPSELFLSLLGISLLFAQAEVNGTLTRVASAAQRLCRGNRGLVPIMFFLFAAGLGSLGPGNIAMAGLIAPVAMAAAVRMQISPLLMAVMVGHGAIASTVSPLTVAGVVANNRLAEMGLQNTEIQVFAYNAAANALMALAGFSLFGGWRLLFRREPMSGDALTTEEAPQSPWTAAHSLTSVVIAVLIVAVSVWKVNIGLAAFVGAAVLFLGNAAPEKETLQRVPWSVIIMVCGVGLLTALLDETGGTERFAGVINRISTPQTATGVLALVTGLVSVYSSTTGVVLPAFLPMVKELAEVQQGSNPLSLALSVLVGGNLVDMSPLSTIGALCLAAHPNPAERPRLYSQLLAWGFGMAFAGALLCWLWF